jgi:diamine N-acetyltransferase
MKTPRIREAIIDDFEYLNELYAHVDQAHHDAHPEQFKQSSDIKRPYSYFEDLLNDKNIKIFVACIEDEIIGFIHAEVKKYNHPVLYSYQYGHITDIAVNKKHKRMGIGKILFQTVEQWFKEMSVKEITLSVFSFNTEAISFYQHNGFTNRHCTMVKSVV